MTDLRKAAEMALEALAWGEIEDAKEHLRQALAQDALKTVVDIDHSLGLFVDSPVREWVGFTDGEKKYLKALGYVGIDAIEAKLKEKNS